MVVGIYGAGGFGREILALLRQTDPQLDFCFIDDAMKGEAHGCKIYSFDQFCSLGSERAVVIAIANGNVRSLLSARCAEAGIPEMEVRAPDVVTRDHCVIGIGSILCDRAIITVDVIIGRNFHANVHCYVAHDCVIGDFVTFGPGAICNGNVHIEDFAYIGAGALLKNGLPGKPLRIGAGAIVGMGAVVTKDVAPGAVVAGNPARILR